MYKRQPDEWTALYRSLWISLASVALAGLVGVPLGFLFARAEFPGRRVLGELLALPVALPPLVGVIAFLPQLPGDGIGAKLLMGLLVIIFGFFFVTVSSRIVGIIGTSSNPVSGMTIATLMGTCLLFVALGWTGDAYQAVALCVGAMVCIAASNAGNTSQDLKTGYILGATPKWQQWGLIIGCLLYTSPSPRD